MNKCLIAEISFTDRDIQALVISDRNNTNVANNSFALNQQAVAMMTDVQKEVSALATSVKEMQAKSTDKDEKRTLMNAIRAPFRRASHVSCLRNIE